MSFAFGSALQSDTQLEYVLQSTSPASPGSCPKHAFSLSQHLSSRHAWQASGNLYVCFSLPSHVLAAASPPPSLVLPLLLAVPLEPPLDDEGHHRCPSTTCC